MVSGRRAHQIPGPLGDHGGDPFGVAPAQRLARENDHAGVHVLGLPARPGVRHVEHLAEPDRVDLQIVGVRGQLQFGFEQRLPRHHDVPTRQIFTAPAQYQAGERHLGSGAADVDADAVQGDVVLLPDRVLREGQIWFVVFVIRVVRHAGEATGTGSPGFGGRSASSAA